jgi:hypothetical protein
MGRANQRNATSKISDISNDTVAHGLAPKDLGAFEDLSSLYSSALGHNHVSRVKVLRNNQSQFTKNLNYQKPNRRADPNVRFTPESGLTPTSTTRI